MATLHDVHTPTLSACSTLPVSQPQPVDGRTIDNTGYCILSLDGGGIRGLSTLYILKSIMEGLNNARKAAGLKSRKPCEIFDLIGGTSTGGLIAIMLGHLEMSVDECIEAYNKMMKRVFEKKKNRSIMGITLKVQARFESEVLKEAISQVIREAGASPNEPFENGRKPKCKVFVCTKTQETNTITHLRNYILPRGSIRNPSILEAALATSAAPTYFTPVEISGSKFVDGAIGANNPAVEVEEEASDIWCEESGQLQPLVKCFISVGTGNPGYRHVSDRSFKYFVETLQKVASETEATNQRWQGRWRKGFNDYRCFRFNVNGLENVGLAEYKEKATIKGVTDTYLEERHTLVQVRRCVENLRMKEYEPTDEFIQRLKERSLEAQQRPSRVLERATSAEISELMQLGNTQLKMHPDRLTTTILSKALHYFSKALYYLKQDPSTSSKQYSRLYQKLMDTSLRLSMLCHSSPSERKEYADQAKEYGEAALINAMRVGDECMVAQIQFHLACASVWKVYLAARRAGVEPRAFPAREEVEVHVVERLGVLQRFGNLEMGWFEEQAEKFLGYLSSPSGTG